MGLFVMPSPDPERQRLGRLGGLTSWSQTSDRHQRMAHARDNSPAADAYHARKLGLDPDRLTDEQRARVETEKKLYFARLRQASAAAMKLQRADRLRRLAAALEAEAGEATA